MGTKAATPAAPTLADAAERPRFSVIVPVYRHWHMVPDLLERLENQSLPPGRFEVIVVDNASPEGPPAAKLPANARILHCGAPGSYAARNHGAHHAGGAWLAFTDADCRPAPDWLEALDEAAAEHGETALIAGPVEVVARSDAPRAPEIYDIVKGIPQAHYVSRGYAATANLAVPKAVFEALGGFDDRRFSGGDAEFCRRAGARGFALVYAPHARVDHPARVTWQEVATKARRIKGGQLTAGPLRNRAAWLLRTFAPPVRGAWRFLRSTAHPLRHRLVAVLVLIRLWGVELGETLRLAAGGKAERQ